MSVVEEKALLAALREFAAAVTSKMTSLAVCEPEDQLGAPLLSRATEEWASEVARTAAFAVCVFSAVSCNGSQGTKEISTRKKRTPGFEHGIE